MSLNLHSGGEIVPYEMLRQLETPPATTTHVPIEHHRLVDLVKSTLGMFGHEVTDEHHAIDHEGQRYFGLLSLKSTHTGYTDTCGLRNSHDKKFPIGISFGARVFVCSNLSFIGDHVIRRKHTANAKRMLPGLVMEIIEPLAQLREAQAKTVERYKAAQITDRMADHAIVNMYRRKVISVQRIPHVLSEWEKPRFEDFQERNAWRLFNAATYALSGRIVENAAITPRLHEIIDAACEVTD